MKIDSYEFGRIVIDGQEYDRDLILFPDVVKENWWRKKGHDLSLNDIIDILYKKPDILIIGTGYSGLMNVSDEVIEEIKSRGIELIIETTIDAVKIFNEKIKKLKDKKIVAALHLTC